MGVIMAFRGWTRQFLAIAQLIMLISKETADARLQSPRNLANAVEHKDGKFEVKPLHPSNGQGRNGSGGYTQDERELIGTLAHLDTSTNVSKAFDVPGYTVRTWRQGFTSLNPKHNPTDFKEAIDRNLGRVRSTALDKLMDSLGLLTTDKMKGANAVQLVTIADKLGNIVVKTSPQQSVGAGVNIVVFTPNQKPLSEFDVMDIESVG